jgi:uncharacterized protein DUF1905
MTPMKKYKFKARIEAGDRGGAYVLFPYDVEKEFGTRGRVPVKAVIEGVEYRGSLMKYGFPQHFLGVEKAIRQQIGKGPDVSRLPGNLPILRSTPAIRLLPATALKSNLLRPK